MKKIILKSLLFIITFVLCIVVLNKVIYAAESEGGLSGSGLVGKFDGTLSGGIKTKVNNLTQNSIGPVLSVIRIVSIGVAVIMITFLGIKYVSSAPAEKASIKNQLIALVAGVVLISVATKVIEIMKDASTNLFQ